MTRCSTWPSRRLTPRVWGTSRREAVVATMGRDAKRYGSTAEVDAALAHAGVGGRVDYNEFPDYIHEQRLRHRFRLLGGDQGRTDGLHVARHPSVILP